MSWLLDMNREEREEHVILLYKEGRTFKEIAKEMLMSFRDIGAIINKAKLQVERERGYTNDEEPKSPESKAFKLFSEGKSPLSKIKFLLEFLIRREQIVAKKTISTQPKIISS